MDSLFSATVKNKQYRSVDFCKIGNFSYTPLIKQTNMNLALFAYGSLRHFLALTDGTLPAVKQTELISRLQHCVNVLDIVCLGSTLTDFDTHAWKVGKEYDAKIIRDIEQGLKHWDTLDRAIDPTAWTYAKELAPPKPKPNSQVGKVGQSTGSGGKMCTTWNGFKKDGCHYEANNPGETCVFQHVCNKCKAKGSMKKHKAWQCDDKDGTKQQVVSSNTSSANVTPAPVVTVTSG